MDTRMDTLPVNNPVNDHPKAFADKPAAAPRWTVAAIEALFALPFNDLLFRAQQVHREHFDANAVQLSTLLSIKTGGCPEDCGYCPQAARYQTGVENEDMLSVDEVVAAARAAREHGATRFCMGAAWRGPKQRDLDKVVAMVKAVRGLGMETCATLGMLKPGQADQLRDAGLDYYNHNIDTAAEIYGEGDHHPRLRRSHRHADPGARRRPACLLRRHRRHGRDATRRARR